MRAPDHARNPIGAAPGKRQKAAPRTAAGPAAAMLALQRTIGNAATARLMDTARHQHGEGCGHQETPVQRSTVQDALREPGQPLAAPLRTEMEARLGSDFSDVRLHTDATAQRSAAGIGARAYTSGSHIVVGAGGSDRHTLAHELTHVIQQRQGPVAGTDHGGGVALSDPSDRFERAAEENATRVMSGPVPGAAEHAEPAAHTTPVAAPGGAPVQRLSLGYDGAWSQKYIKDGHYMSLLEAAAPGARAEGIEAPFAALLRQVEAGKRQVNFKEGKPAVGAASFSVVAGEGVLTIDPPSDSASANTLRDFATTLAHELQHAVDFVNKRFPSDSSAQYEGDAQTQKRKGHIAAELRAFGVEAATAAKLALGDHYEESEKPFSELVSRLGPSSIGPVQQSMALEFQWFASHKDNPLGAFGQRVPVGKSRVLERLAAYLRQYDLMPDPSPVKALDWLRENSEVVERGLIEGGKLFLSHRPQLKK